MKEEEIIYTDGHGVKITREKFSVEDREFYLNGITSIDLQRIPAGNTPNVILFILGALCILAGSLELFNNFSYATSEAVYFVNSNMLVIGLGVLLLIAGIIRMVIAKDKYAVKIGTAEGEKKPFMSKDREHAAIIAASLKKAYYRYAKENKLDGRINKSNKAETIVIP